MFPLGAIDETGAKISHFLQSITKCITFAWFRKGTFRKCTIFPEIWIYACKKSNNSCFLWVPSMRPVPKFHIFYSVSLNVSLLHDFPLALFENVLYIQKSEYTHVNTPITLVSFGCHGWDRCQNFTFLQSITKCITFTWFRKGTFRKCTIFPEIWIYT